MVSTALCAGRFAISARLIPRKVAVTDHLNGAGPKAAIRLVESTDGWLLTVTPEGVAALLAGRKNAPGSAPTEVSVEVHPNLVPGEPFLATVQVAELAPGHR